MPPKKPIKSTFNPLAPEPSIFQVLPLKKRQKNTEITEDDLRKLESDNQKLTDKFVHHIDEVIKKKEEEILAI